MTLILVLIALAGCASSHRPPEQTVAVAVLPPPAPVPYDPHHRAEAAAAEKLRAQYAILWGLVPAEPVDLSKFPVAVPSYPKTIAVPGAVTPAVPCPKGRLPVTQAEVDACQDAKLREVQQATDALIEAVGVDDPK